MKPSNLILCSVLCGFIASAQETIITVQADIVKHRVTRYLTGACIEDVNHEVYGGIDSQMIFGESFAEPAQQPPLKGFTAYGGLWTPSSEGVLQAAGGPGPKLVAADSLLTDGEVSVQIFFERVVQGNAGLILKIDKPGNGADRFTGYEVSLEPSGHLVLGRHRQNWEPLQRVPCRVPLNEWVSLCARFTGAGLDVFVDDQLVTQFNDVEHPISSGLIGLRTWQTDAQFRTLTITSSNTPRSIPFAYADPSGFGGGVSGMWRALRRGTADGLFTLEENQPFSGRQSQRISFVGGVGEIGIENQSLNRWGMNFVKGKPYEGYVWVRSAEPAKVSVSLESGDGSAVYAEKALSVKAGDWQRLDFTLKPDQADRQGRFAIKLKRPGTITVGYAFLQPGPWGRFKGLPVRKDVAAALIDQGITVLRQGGCMANAAEYRWKKMIGPRAQRAPYAGWWYPHSSNGWGIFDFLNFCEAAGFLAIPDVNIDETPQDMADFLEYVNGAADSAWGRKRVQDGHPSPYRLKHLQIGNEEKVNEGYWQRFKPIAEAIWAKDPELILVVGDFLYAHSIKDPFQVTGAAGGIATLAAHQKILRLAKEHGREVWFDVHMGTDGPEPDFGGTLSYVDALEKLAEGAKHRVVIFEFNAGNHSHRRALANATALNMIERDGRIPVVTSANCLQPDGQNDNDWDQGLLFLNPSKVWLQPPGYVTQMLSRNYQPLVVDTTVQARPGHSLDASAKRSEDGKTLVLQVVNGSDRAESAALQIVGIRTSQSAARVEELSGSLHAVNTAHAPTRIKPYTYAWRHGLKNGKSSFTFAPHSFTIIRFE